MQNTATAVAVAAAFAPPACDDQTPQERMAPGGLTGAAVGIVGADAFDADRNWTTAPTGAAAGALVARNPDTRQCAPARRDGTYVVRACP